MSDRTMSTRQLAEALGVSESSVKRWVDEGEIAAERTTGGHRRIPIAAAVDFMRTRRVQPENPHQLAMSDVPMLGRIDEATTGALYDALLEDDAPAARAIVCGRFLSGASVAAIGDGLLRPVLERIGELWKDDPRGILVEHRAVQTCLQALAQITEWIPGPGAEAPAGLTAAGPTDPYSLPPIIASMTLRECGFGGRNLGPLTPLPIIGLAVAQYQPAICVISVSVVQDTPVKSAWRSLQKRLSEAECRLVVGGRCVSTIADALAPSTHIAGTMAELAAFAKGLAEGARAGSPDADSPRARRDRPRGSPRSR